MNERCVGYHCGHTIDDQALKHSYYGVLDSQYIISFGNAILCHTALCSPEETAPLHP